MNQDAFNEQVTQALKNIAGGLSHIVKRLDALESPDVQALLGRLLLANHLSGNVQSVINEMSVAECLFLRWWLSEHRQEHARIIEAWGLDPQADNFWSREVLPLVEKRVARAYNEADGRRSGVGGRHS